MFCQVHAFFKISKRLRDFEKVKEAMVQTFIVVIILRYFDGFGQGGESFVNEIHIQKDFGLIH